MSDIVAAAQDHKFVFEMPKCCSIHVSADWHDSDMVKTKIIKVPGTNSRNRRSRMCNGYLPFRLRLGPTHDPWTWRPANGLHISTLDK